MTTMSCICRYPRLPSHAMSCSSIRSQLKVCLPEGIYCSQEYKGRHASFPMFVEQLQQNWIDYWVRVALPQIPSGVLRCKIKDFDANINVDFQVDRRGRYVDSLWRNNLHKNITSHPPRKRIGSKNGSIQKHNVITRTVRDSTSVICCTHDAVLYEIST